MLLGFNKVRGRIRIIRRKINDLCIALLDIKLLFLELIIIISTKEYLMFIHNYLIIIC